MVAKRLLSLWLVLVTTAGLSIVALPATAADPEPNVALGKTYTFAAAPTKTWYGILEKAGQPLPDAARVLTDGEFCKSKSFWSSNKALNFRGTSHCDVLVDLGKTHPLSEVYTHHSARPMAGIRLPYKEEYFVSEDSKRFVKAGEFVNTEDPRVLNDPNERGTLFEGIMKFTSGPIRTKGRYLLVRTHTVQQGFVGFRGYVGYDEIVATRGSFAAESIRFGPGDYVSVQPRSYDASFMGYRFGPRNWTKILAKTPLHIALSPQHLLGDDEYHMSVGGVYVLQFECSNNASAPVTDIEFTLRLPSSVTLLDYNGALEMVDERDVDIEGRTYREITQAMKPGKLGAIHSPVFVVAPTATDPSPGLGTFTYRYSYTIKDKRIESSEETAKIILGPRLTAPSPKRFVTGFWLPYASRTFINKADTFARLFAFYKELGFNCANGGQSSPEIHAALTGLGMANYTGSGLAPNALMFANWMTDIREQIPAEDLFQGHPKAYRGNYKNTYGVCPTKFCSEKYAALRVEAAKRLLAYTDHLYENWEPYMFHGKGCICAACKADFQRHADLYGADIDRLWPDVILDVESRPYASFSSYQYGNVVKVLQAAVTQAGKELQLSYKPAYILSIAPKYFDPKTHDYQIHNPREYLGQIDKLLIWKYGNTVNPKGVDASLMIGNNLPILRDFDNTTAMVGTYGRKVEGEQLPKVIYLPTEHYSGNLVMPKDYYFISLLTFFHGLDGYGTWCRDFKQDARYLALHAKANAMICRYEGVVMDGVPKDQHRLAVVWPKTERGGEEIQTVYSREFVHQDQRYIVVGNDHVRKTFAKLTIMGAPGQSQILTDETRNVFYVNSTKRPHTGKELGQGVLVELQPKQWHVFRVGSLAGMPSLPRITPAAVEASLEAARK